jgi:excinuclease ABC subunit A
LTTGSIELRGIGVHNLRHIDLDIPRQKLVVVCGVSGSGKTSLALDTLYAEGQRRYIESFSAYTRQFLERLDKPEAERIEGIPPAIAVTHKNRTRSGRATVGTSTEIVDYLRLLYARIGKLVCYQCDRPVQSDSPDSATEAVCSLSEGTRFMISFPIDLSDDDSLESIGQSLREDGFVRWIIGQKVLNLDPNPSTENGSLPKQVHVVVDRLTVGRSEPARIRESFEMAMAKANGACHCIVATENEADLALSSFQERLPERVLLDDKIWLRLSLSRHLACGDCGREYPQPEPNLFSFNRPLGACSECEGFGNLMDIDMDLVVPDPNKSISEGAIAPWNTPAYKHELEELLDLADAHELPVDEPFRKLRADHLKLIQEGVPERDFGGLRGFFNWLERRKYKMHIRVFLSRWRSYRICETCQGTRLNSDALATRVGGKNIAQLCSLQIREARVMLSSLDLSEREAAIGAMLLDQVQSRLGFLEAVGLGYLSLDRPMRTMSSGEAQRVTLTSALGSSLVNMMYVLDEPSVGLHPDDVQRLTRPILSLRDRGNSVVMVEHDDTMIGIADHVIEIGPGAGLDGGNVVFDGTPSDMRDDEQSLTGNFLSGRRSVSIPQRRRESAHGWLRLSGASGHNLKNINVEFPLGVLCLVTGVSGSGKSTLVEQTLYPALCRRKRKDVFKPEPFSDVVGDGQIEDIVLIDQSPIGRSPRSNPVTYIKAFDAIRNVFAETLTARTHNYKASHFSFNVDGGRCTACKGDGHVQIDMQFLADIMMKCSQCGGSRYRREILEVTYRGRNIANVLNMTAREAFTFFRGQPKVQGKLKQLIDVGLQYLPLGQAANTLSTGEAQRLRLASYLSSPRRGRTLFLMDEPTTGLHFADIVQLLDCFDALINVGHSLIIVEHNPQMMLAADFIIDLGPGAADEGGTVVAHGTPEEVSHCEESPTGRLLARLLNEK